MKLRLVSVACLVGFALAPGARAQTPDSLLNDTSYGQPAGTHEITIGGGGSSNTEFDSSSGALDFSFGTYLTTQSLWVIRQSVGYSNPDNAPNGWTASTRLVYDYSLSADGKARPFIGVSAGRVYGNIVRDSWTAGLEAGGKFFVKPQTFVFAMASYEWLFEHGSQIRDQFDRGRFGWNLGLGYQF